MPEPCPPPEGWTLRQAAEALCPEAVRLHCDGGESLAAALRCEMGKWADLLPPAPDLWLAERLLAALAARPDLALTGRDFAQGVAAPRFTVPADVVQLAAAPERRIYLDLELAADAARILYRFPAPAPDLPRDVELSAVRVVAAPDASRRAEAPAPAAEPLAPPPRPAFAPNIARLWYRARVAGWRRDTPPPSEADDLAAMRAAHEGTIPRDFIREVRRELAPAEWRKSGPRKPR